MGDERAVPPQLAPTCWKRLPTPSVVPIFIGERAVELTHEADPGPPDHGWECSACTYVNSVGEHLRCGMCNSPRQCPEPAPSPAQHRPEPESEQQHQNHHQQPTSALNDDAGAECAICIDKIVAADIASAECGHKFCTACILQWLETGHQHCPMCKAAVAHLRVRRQLDGTRVEEPISEPVVLLLRARWRERPAILPQSRPYEPGIDDWSNGFEEEEDLLLRGRASSRVVAEHRAGRRVAGGGGGTTLVAKKKAPAVCASVTVQESDLAARSTHTSPFAGMVGCKYRCVAPKAYATEEISPAPYAGLEVSVVEQNTIITCLEARMVAGRNSKGQSLRLRCEAGWVSYVAANGTQLFELECAADGTKTPCLARRNHSSLAAGRQGKKKTKKERRAEKNAAKAARRREHKLAESVANTRTPRASKIALVDGGGGGGCSGNSEQRHGL